MKQTVVLCDKCKAPGSKEYTVDTGNTKPCISIELSEEINATVDLCANCASLLLINVFLELEPGVIYNLFKDRKRPDGTPFFRVIQ